MQPNEWVEAVVLELTNNGAFYNLHQGCWKRLSVVSGLNMRSGCSRKLWYSMNVNVRVTLYDNIRAALIKYYDETTQPSPETEKEKPTMTNQTVETKTFVGGVEASTLDDDAIFKAIQREEDEIKKWEAIDNKPKKLEEKIKAKKANIAALVKLVDER